MSKAKPFGHRGRHNAPTEEQYLKALKGKKRMFIMSTFPAFKEDRDIGDWIDYLVDHTGNSISSYLRSLVVADRNNRWPEIEKGIKEKEDLLEELS